VGDENLPPVITSDGGGSTAAKSIPENTTAVTDVDATDPDAGATITYSISGGADASKFTINATSGILAFGSAPNFESPTDVGANNVYDVTVRASDGSLFDEQAIAVTVTNVNEFAPVITSNGGGGTAAISVPENQTAVTDVDATDADLTSPAYSVSGGADASKFTINATSGILTFTVAPDFENPTDANGDNVYEVTVTASDGSLTDSQALSVAVTDVGEVPRPLYFSLRDAATVGGISATNEDVLYYDGSSTFSLVFDGSDVGLGSFRIDAFSWLDADSLLLSFDSDKTLSGLAVDDSDVVRFDATSLGPTTAGTFSVYFDGSDVGLTSSSHDVDAFELLAGGGLLLSTTGSLSLPGLSAADEDLLLFTPTSLGPDTAGAFALYFDGSDVGLSASGEDVDAAALDAAGRVYLSTDGSFAVPGLSGEDDDVFVFTPTSTGATTAGTYDSALYFDGSTFGLTATDVLAVDLP
jgi:hypothetical protein